MSGHSKNIRRLKMFVASLEELENDTPASESTADTTAVAENAEPVAAIADATLPKGDEAAAPVIEGEKEGVVAEVAPTATAVTEVAPAPETPVPAVTEAKAEPVLSAEPVVDAEAVKQATGTAATTEISNEDAELAVDAPAAPAADADVTVVADGEVVAATDDSSVAVGDDVVVVDAELLADAEAALQAVVDAEGDVEAANVDVDTLAEVAEQLQETLSVATESLVDGVIPAFTQKFMAVNLRAAYRRIGLEADVSDVEAPEPIVSEDVIPVEPNEAGGGPGVPVTVVGNAAGIDEAPQAEDNASAAPTVAEDTVAALVFEGTASTEAFADQVKAFWATLVKALKAAWAKVVDFFKAVFTSHKTLDSLLRESEKTLSKSKFSGKIDGSVGCKASFFSDNEKTFEETFVLLRKYAHLNSAYVGHNDDPGEAFKKLALGANIIVGEGHTTFSVSDLKASVAEARSFLAKVKSSESLVKSVAKVIDELDARDIHSSVTDVKKYREALQKQMSGMRNGQVLLTKLVTVTTKSANKLVGLVKEIITKGDK